LQLQGSSSNSSVMTGSTATSQQVDCVVCILVVVESPPLPWEFRVKIAFPTRKRRKDWQVDFPASQGRTSSLTKNSADRKKQRRKSSFGAEAGTTEGQLAAWLVQETTIHLPKRSHHAHVSHCPRNRKCVASSDAVVEAMAPEDRACCNRRIECRERRDSKKMGCNLPGKLPSKRKHSQPKCKFCCCEGRKRFAESGTRGRPPNCCHDPNCCSLCV